MRFWWWFLDRWGGRGLWYALAGAGLLLYLGEALASAHAQQVVLDEGAYLYKGWLFLRGTYRPFQPYGPWTNKMPWAFGLYGAVQALVRPGLDVGRYFAVGCSVVALVSLGWLLHRWTHPAVVAGTLWLAALTPSWPRIYSLAVTEAPVAALLLSALAVAVRREPRPVALVLGGALAGGAAALRLNMTPAWGVLVLWLGWLYGWRRALWFLAGSLAVLGVEYALYWPEIGRLWLQWLPERWATALGQPAAAEIGSPVLGQAAAPALRWASLRDTARAHPALWMGWLGATLWGWRCALRHPQGAFYRRLWLGLFALGWLLLALHFGVTVGWGQQALVSNLSLYVGFFAPLLALVVGLAWGFPGDCPASRRWEQGLWWAAAGALVGAGIWEEPMVLVGAKARGGFLLRRFARFVAPQLAAHLSVRGQIGMGLALLALPLLGVLGGLWWRLRQSPKRPPWWPSLPWTRDARRVWLGGVLGMMLLSPLPFLGGGFRPYDCPRADTLARQREVAQQLSTALRPGDRVAWEGGLAVTPLLSLPFEVRTFPPQYNGVYNFRSGGEAERLYRWGYWNQALARRWRAQADALVASRAMAEQDEAFQAALREAPWEPVAETSPLRPCEPRSALIVFRRMSP